MKRVLNSEFCKEIGELGPNDIKLDNNRMKFILKKKFRHMSGRRRLGLIWLVLDPIVVSVVYLFIFTVLRASTRVESIFIGITLFRLMQVSLKLGMNSVKDFLKLAFSIAGLNYRKHLKIDKSLLRPSEVETLRANYSKAKRILKWKCILSFKETISMIAEWYKNFYYTKDKNYEMSCNQINKYEQLLKKRSIK